MHPGQHPQFEFLGMAFNYDTIISTVVASAILLGLGFFVRAKVTSGVPNGTQLFFETVIKQVREQVESFIGIKVAPFLVPLGVALFVFILTCNWMSVLPIHWDGHPVLPPPTSDINLVFAMVAVLLVWWHVAGIRQRGGAGKHVVQTLKGHYPPFAPMWIIEEIVHPVSLGLRLFGNIFAGGIMVELLALLPAYIFWLPAAGWKLFDMGIGALQAYLFMLLTINYFAEAMEVREGAH
jgi:F-type H+-transporting ATPase subunit a